MAMMLAFRPVDHLESRWLIQHTIAAPSFRKLIQWAATQPLEIAEGRRPLPSAEDLAEFKKGVEATFSVSFILIWSKT